MPLSNNYLDGLERSRQSLGKMLEGCKQFALLDYHQNADQEIVRGRFIESVREALAAARHDDILKEDIMKDVGLVSLMQRIRLDTIQNFEADIDTAIRRIIHQAG